MPSSETTSVEDFNPRPPRGGRRRPQNASASALQFQSTPSARRATLDGRRVLFFFAGFQSTPSARRATGWHVSGFAFRCDFNPRPPRGGRPAMQGTTGRRLSISIHALREEGDTATAWRISASGYFNPRPPRGGRRSGTSTSWRSKEISIHALREEGDTTSATSIRTAANFNPRPPRGGRPFILDNYGSQVGFQSTPSARRATMLPWRPIINSEFQSTPSARRATVRFRLMINKLLFQSTPSARRATS